MRLMATLSATVEYAMGLLYLTLNQQTSWHGHEEIADNFLGIFNQRVVKEKRTGMTMGYLSDEVTTDPFKVSVGNKRTDSKLNKPPRGGPASNPEGNRVATTFSREIWEDFAERAVYNLHNDS
jgi:hypothetical protein